jgi:hypothetical protein
VQQAYAPTPLQIVVLIGLTPATYEGLIKDAGLMSICAEAEVIEGGQVSAMQTQPGAGVLVLVGSLNDHALIQNHQCIGNDLIFVLFLNG